MRKKDKDVELLIAKSVLSELPNDKLLGAKKFFDSLFDFKRVTKLYNTYIEGVETSLENTGNGRMYALYNMDGAVTGRLSNSGANTKRSNNKEGKLGVSFHTLPREQEDFNIRDYVVAPPGYNFITVDMKAMELRILAHVANEENMISAFKSGIDLHDYSTEMTFKIKKGNTLEHEWKLKRQIAKEVSFLTVYGGKAYTLANKRNIAESHAQEIIDGWMRTFPGVGKYMNTVLEYIKQHKYAKTIFGRYRHLPNIDSPQRNIREQAFRQGLNFTIQSAASDVLICGLIGSYNEFKKRKLNAKIVATVHDSVCVICPENEVGEVIKICKKELVEYTYLKNNFGISLSVPLDIEIKLGTSFGNGIEVK